MVAILGGRGFAEGDTQFSVPILPSQEQPSRSTAPRPPVIEEQPEELIILPPPGSPDHTPLLASTQSTPRRSPRIRSRLSRQSNRPTISNSSRKRSPCLH